MTTRTRRVSARSDAGLSGKIRARFDALSVLQQQVASFVLEQPNRAAVLSATRIADELQVSPSTVVRVARAVGFDGFPELQREIQRELFSETNTLRRLDQTAKDVPTGPLGVLERVLLEDIHHIEETRRTISPAAFESAVALLTRATRVYVLGLFVSTAPAHILAMGLRLIGVDARTAGDARTDVADELLGAGPGTVVVALSVARYPTQTVRAFEEARSFGAATIAITDRPTSPLATRADVALVVGSGPMPFFQSLTAAVSLVNALVTSVSLATPRRSQASLKRAEELWERHATFFPDTPARP